jgi:FtsH-binding integral membrane protein
VAAEAGVAGGSPDSMAQSLLGWVMGCALVYSALFGSGSALYGNWPQAAMWLVVFVVSGGVLLRLLPRMWAGSGAA